MFIKRRISIHKTESKLAVWIESELITSDPLVLAIKNTSSLNRAFMKNITRYDFSAMLATPWPFRSTYRH